MGKTTWWTWGICCYYRSQGFGRCNKVREGLDVFCLGEHPELFQGDEVMFNVLIKLGKCSKVSKRVIERLQYKLTS